MNRTAEFGIDIPSVRGSQILGVGFNREGPSVRVHSRGDRLGYGRVDILIDQDNVKCGGISPGSRR